jgi:catechol 2,3-dioxygenase-like lactoylglutathione lyase family enzyme
MFSHITVGTNDISAAKAFYDAVLAPLGIVCRYADADWLGYGPPEGLTLANGASIAQLCIMKPFDGRPATSGNGWHVALIAPDHAAVHAFHSAALAAGGLDDGPPGPRPQYGPHYYAAYVRDLDGNKLQAVNYSGRGAS